MQRPMTEDGKAVGSRVGCGCLCLRAVGLLLLLLLLSYKQRHARGWLEEVEWELDDVAACRVPTCSLTDAAQVDGLVVVWAPRDRILEAHDIGGHSKAPVMALGECAEGTAQAIVEEVSIDAALVGELVGENKLRVMKQHHVGR